jgi:hypothetical protein
MVLMTEKGVLFDVIAHASLITRHATTTLAPGKPAVSIAKTPPDAYGRLCENSSNRLKK